MKIRKLIACVAIALGCGSMWAQDLPTISNDLSTIDGCQDVTDELISSGASFSGDFTLEFTGTVGQEVKFVQLEKIYTYTPSTTGVVRIVSYNGVTYVYENNAYKSTISASVNPSQIQYGDQLLVNEGFDTPGNELAANKWSYGEPWVSNVTFAATGIRFGMYGANTVLVWRGSRNDNYLSQPLISIKPNTKYLVELYQVASGNANASFNVGFGTNAGGLDLGNSTVKLGTGNEGVKTAEITTSAKVPSTVYFTFRNTSNNTASSGSDPVSQLDYIYLKEVIVSYQDGNALTGCTGAKLVKSAIFPAATPAAAYNLNFTESVLDVNVRTVANDIKDSDVSGMQPVNGWVIPSGINGATDNHASGVFAYESTNFNGGPGYTAPAKATSESTGNALGILAVWGSTTQYVQPVTLAAGSYTITVPVYNKIGGTKAIAKNMIGFVKAGGSEYYAETKQYQVNEWVTEKINFTLEEDAVGFISLGYRSINEGSGSNPHLFVDCITISSLDLTPWTDAKSAAEVVLDSYDKKYAATERQAVIDAMKASDPTSATQMEAMVNDLNAKVATYKVKAANEKLVEGKKDLTDAIARIKAEYLHSSADLLKTDISKWPSSTFVANNGSEHWSGQKTNYYEQTGAQWGQDSWSISAENTLNLPVGKYAFVVTARASEGATSKMTVNDTEVVLSNVGSEGRGVATDGEATYENTKTYARNNEGYGWEYAYVEFELAEAKDVTFKFEASANSRQQWVSIANPVLYYDDTAANNLDLVAAKAALLESAKAVTVPTANIGTAAFQYPTGTIDAIKATIDDAKAVAESATSTIDEVYAAKDAVAAIKIPALNAPAEGQKFHIAISFDGYTYNNHPFEPNQNKTGGISIPRVDNTGKDYRWNAFTFTPVDGVENAYTISIVDSEGTTWYVCTGKQANGTSEVQIRMSDDAEKSLPVIVSPTAKEGIYNLKNSRSNNSLIGCQDDNQEYGGLYTCKAHNDITITVAQQATATLAISDAQYGTFIAPFDAEIPTGVTVYKCEEVAGDTLTLKVADAIKANTAYIVYAEEPVNKTLSGWGLATKDAYETGVLTGSYELAPVEVGKYLLQNNGKVGFYLVAEEGFKIGANRCYLTASETTEEGKAFYFDNATAIEAINALAAGNVKTIYNAAGAAQKNLVRGLNIVKTADGKTVKVMVK